MWLTCGGSPFLESRVDRYLRAGLHICQGSPFCTARLVSFPPGAIKLVDAVFKCGDSHQIFLTPGANCVGAPQRNLPHDVGVMCVMGEPPF